MEARHYVATAPRSRPDYRLKTAFCEQSSLASFAFAAPASTHFSCNRASKQRSKARNGAQASLSNGPAGGGSSLSRQNDEEGSVLEDIASLFCSCEKLKAMVDSSLNSGVGPDMRNRVGHLFKRVDMLNQSVERAAGIAGGRVPAQLIASFKASAYIMHLMSYLHGISYIMHSMSYPHAMHALCIACLVHPVCIVCLIYLYF